MYKVIDLLDNSTGWTPSIGSTITVYGLNQIPEFIAGINTNSLILSFPAGNNGKSIEKDITFDFTGLREITFHVWSRYKKTAGQDYKLSSDFAYKIDFGTGKEYYFPVFNSFKDVTIDLTGATSLSKIKITPLFDDDDYLIISYLVGSKDEIPADIFQGVKEQLNYELKSVYDRIINGVANKGIKLGTLTSLVTGDKSIYFPNGIEFAQRYSVIYIEGGGHSEIHQLAENDEREFHFSSQYSGETLLNNYASADIYLFVPAEFNQGENEINLPGINIWGMIPEEIMRSEKSDTARDTFAIDETVQSRLTPVTFSYIINIDCEARQDEMIALMSLACRSMIARQFIWVNGKKLNLFLEGIPTFVEPQEGYNEIPKIQFNTRVEIREDIWKRLTLVRTNTNTITYNFK